MRYEAVLQTGDVQRVIDVMSRHDFNEAFCKAVGVAYEIGDLSSDDGRSAVQMEWTFPTADLLKDIPRIARKFVPDQITLHWQQEWKAVEEAERNGSIHVSGRPNGQEVRIVGTTQLRSHREGLAYSLDAKTTVGIPVVGSKLADQIERKLVAKIFDDQVRVLNGFV